ncbi:MAG: hypothetical protein HY049_20210 [Acidobacteria bacterium]|nr:hypothetical protein [Acidobacteriota bacterium]
MTPRTIAAAFLLASTPLLAADASAPGAVPLFDNLGTWHHAVTTKAPLAQKYFDQGLRLMYGFNHDEARRAFDEAARLDPDCAMAFWGSALTLGPNYNMAMDAESVKSAYASMRKAVDLAPKATPAERAYIGALSKRYADDPNADRKALDAAYADAMRGVAKSFPNDSDALTLFAESMMDLRPWDLWTKDGRMQPGTGEIIASLEAALKVAPDNPGANHYYMHAVEMSPNPEKGLEAALRLPKLVPGAGHLVHMPGHIYMRMGRYGDAAAANVPAIEADRKYIAAANPPGMYPMMYYPHNIHFLWSASMMAGRSADALKASKELEEAVPLEAMKAMPMLEYFTGTTLFTRMRFGRWDEVLALPAPAPELKYATAIWHYARGVAFAAKGDRASAVKEQAAFDASVAAVPPDSQLVNNSAGNLIKVVRPLLAGEIAARTGDPGAAIARLEEAVAAQDALTYDEPPPWFYPVRETLGAALIAAGKWPEAEAVYRKDLEINPESGWSLHALALCLDHRKAAEAAPVKARFEKAWATADVKLAGATP